MTHETDLADRVAALERRLTGTLPPAPRGRANGIAAGLLLVAMLTVNLWVFWQIVSDQRKSRLEHCFWIVSQPGATAQQRCDAFTALVSAGNRQWRSARLRNLKLRGADLQETHLQMIDLLGSDLSDANLKSANLHGANLELTKLARANLMLADLSEAFLRKVDLTSANVSRADLRTASLEQSDLVDTDFERADMTEANLLLAVLTRANLKRANLSWAVLDAADLTGADLEEANLENASIKDTYFGGCNWWRAKGLPSAVIQRFKTEFPPGQDSSTALRDDYVKWLGSQ